MVDTGKDKDFGRGASYYDLYRGDPDKKGRTEATLGKIEGDHYDAAKAKLSALGTMGGPKTDTLGRVHDLDLKAIRGLYAPGDEMRSMMGITQGGGGGMLGPGMVCGKTL